MTTTGVLPRMSGKAFQIPPRYTVFHSRPREEFIDILTGKRTQFCKIAILGLHDSKEQFEMIDS